ncbi:MAG: MFS transporter [Deltaproteobacteria bacterium]|nr:MFS transporter [Deltaproteobacteria bacterium]
MNDSNTQSKRNADFRGTALLFLLFLWIVWFISFTARMIFSPLLPLMEDEFHISHAGASGIFLFISGGYGLSVFSAGIYGGRFGYKKTIFASLILSALVFLLIPFAGNFTVLYVFSLIFGISTGAYLPCVIPLITDYFAEKHWGKSIAIHDSAAPIGIFSAPFLALFFLGFLHWRQIFTVFGILFLMLAVLFHFISDELKIEATGGQSFRNVLKNRSLWILSILWIFAAGSNIGIYFIAPLYLTKELHLSIGHADSALGISRLGGMAVAIACGYLADWFNLKKIMFAILLLTGLFTIALSVASTKWVAVALFFQATFVTGFFPLTFVMTARLFRQEERGMATGFMLTMGIMLGGGLVPYLLGIAGDLISFRAGILVIGLLVALSSMFIFKLDGTPEKA